MKKTTTVLLVLITVFSACALFVSAEESRPYYNNVRRADNSVSISASGNITITNTFTGIQDVTSKAFITTYIEKKTLGLFWTRVDNGQENKQWYDKIYNYTYTGSHSMPLPSTGIYRITTEFEIYGSGGSTDTITQQKQVTYE